MEDGGAGGPAQTQVSREPGIRGPKPQTNKSIAHNVFSSVGTVDGYRNCQFNAKRSMVA